MASMIIQCPHITVLLNVTKMVNVSNEKVTCTGSDSLDEDSYDDDDDDVTQSIVYMITSTK